VVANKIVIIIKEVGINGVDNPVADPGFFKEVD